MNLGEPEDISDILEDEFNELKRPKVIIIIIITKLLY
jgi:hypothetical protein